MATYSRNGPKRLPLVRQAGYHLLELAEILANSHLAAMAPQRIPIPKVVIRAPTVRTPSFRGFLQSRLQPGRPSLHGLGAAGWYGGH